VQNVVHEHDAEREERTEPERDRQRGGHHSAHQRDPECVEEAGLALVVGYRMRRAELREARDAEERDDERQRIDEEHERVRAMVDRERKCSQPQQRRRWGCFRTTPRMSPFATGAVVGRHEIGDRRIAGRKTMLATSTRKPNRYTHHSAHEGPAHHHRAARSSRSTCGGDPNAGRSRRQRPADRRGQQLEREDPTDRDRSS
jgi:hypothetical protein